MTYRAPPVQISRREQRRALIAIAVLEEHLIKCEIELGRRITALAVLKELRLNDEQEQSR